MYENIRNQIFSKKRKGAVSQSRLSSSEKGQVVQAPELVKHKTQQPLKNRRNRNSKKENQIFEQQQSQNAACSHNQPQPKLKAKIGNDKHRRSENTIPNDKQKQQSNLRNVSSRQETPENRKKRSTRLSKQQQKEHEMDVQKQQQKYKLRSNQKNKQKVLQVQSIGKSDKQQSMSAEQQQSQQKIKNQVKVKPKGRKGRPPKSQALKNKQNKQQQFENQNQISENQQQAQENTNIKKRPRKMNRINKIFQENIEKDESKVMLNQQGNLSQNQIQTIRNYLGNRKQLAKYLLQLSINTGNIKQILDLGVSIVLQDGPITKYIHLLLSTLKATLLHKYFPDNNKHRRKFQKMIKQKKKALIHSQQSSNENNDQNENLNNDALNKQEDEQKEQKNEEEEDKQKKKRRDRLPERKNQKQDENQGKNEMLEIKTKAIQKLQKMIKKVGVKEGAKNYAIKIENTFQQGCDMSGQPYKSLAYRRMRQFKTELGQLDRRKAQLHDIRDYIQRSIKSFQCQNAKQRTSEDLHIRK